MPLGLITKDSIQDLTSLGGTSPKIQRKNSSQHSRGARNATTTEAQDRLALATSWRTSNYHPINQNPPSAEVTTNDDRSAPSTTTTTAGANPQQAPLSAPVTTAPGGFRYDMSDYSNYYYGYDQPQQQQPMPNSTNKKGNHPNDHYYYMQQQNQQQYNEANTQQQQQYAVDPYYDDDEQQQYKQQQPSVYQVGDKHPKILPLHNNNLWCCIFPWLMTDSTRDIALQSPPPLTSSSSSSPEGEDKLNNNQKPQPNEISATNGEGTTTPSEQPQQNASAVNDNNNDSFDGDDSCSTSSNTLGEKLSDRDRQALLARLRLAQPEAAPIPKESDTYLDTSSSSCSVDPIMNHNDSTSIDVGGTSRRMSLSGGPSPHSKKGILNDLPPSAYNNESSRSMSFRLKQMNQPPQPLRGILKRRSVTSMDPIIIMKNGVIMSNGGGSISSDTAVGSESNHKNDSGRSNSADNVSATKEQQQIRRRSLFPSYEKLGTRKPRDMIRPVRFAPMARVVAVTSRNDMLPEDKADIWWQRSDYEDFRRTGRIITRAMLEGGSEIWLTGTKKSAAASSSKIMIDNTTATTNNKNTLENNNTNGSSSNNKNTKNTKTYSNEDKWWHRFGHSRRGLEHVVSTDEGKQRQLNVKSAIRAVLDEQARQTMYKKLPTTTSASSSLSGATKSGASSTTTVQQPTLKLDDKLRMVALHHTQWARDLALAAGASDADAVESSFAADRRSREFYLLKLAKHHHASSSPSRIPSNTNIKGMSAVGPSATSLSSIRSNSTGMRDQHLVPQFMQPTIQAAASMSLADSAKLNKNTLLMQQRLDANTAAQIRFRTSGARKASTSTSLTSSTASGTTTTTTSGSSTGSSTTSTDGKGEPPIVSPNPSVKASAINNDTAGASTTLDATSSSGGSVDSTSVVLSSSDSKKQEQVDESDNPINIAIVTTISATGSNDDLPSDNGASITTTIPTATTTMNITTTTLVDGESCEPLNDPDLIKQSNSQKLSHKAAGFSVGEVEKVNMAAVLSGMGVL